MKIPFTEIDVRIWWLPPANRKSLDFFTDLPYDGYMYGGLFLWFVHIGWRKPWTEKDFE